MDSNFVALANLLCLQRSYQRHLIAILEATRGAEAAHLQLCTRR